MHNPAKNERTNKQTNADENNLLGGGNKRKREINLIKQ